MTLYGETLDLGPGDPSTSSLCADIDGLDGEALEATITPEGVTYKWQVTGEGATLDNLNSVVHCLASEDPSE